ncbi:GNAT family N-acetyltransferase [Aquibacillus salsiterrae]|uniref:GNAT family N-acetyltransferase n=1 Tax=Aquibacillus salsiterrae TaxID=2950439 RepID=A0A9X3WFX0_9BACI|nr:GNAT family N-acetyltransferase [Aquibacillus salsiterrae]MDC3416704.1 GNAT family N-acetyltransferase [Aquibacillus salsiterrae]
MVAKMGIRMYKAGDEGQIQALFTKVFNKQRSMEEWQWKYINAPGKDNPWILVFEEKEAILGHIALWVFEVYVDGEMKKAGLRIDTMVDPAARGKGIYRELNEAMIEKAKASGISILHGFPAPKAKELLLQYTDGVYVTDISRYYMVLEPWKIAATITKIIKPFTILDGLYRMYRLRKVKLHLPTGYLFEAVEQCDARFDVLADKTKMLKPVMMKRDASYLNWRYVKRPGHNYTIFTLVKDEELQGYIVVKKETMKKKTGELSLGYVVDWLAIDDEKNWEYLIQGALTYLKDTDLIQAWSFPANQMVPKMHYFGLKERDRPMPFIVHHLDTDETVLDAANWWYTQGDVDSF